jgi:hypothetical protein
MGAALEAPIKTELDYDLIEVDTVVADVDVSGLDLDQTLKMIEEQVGQIAKRGFLLGKLILRAQELGYDATSLVRRPIMAAARDVALGFLAAEAFAAYHARPDILRQIRSIPIEQQRKIVDNGTVPVCEIVGKEITHRFIDVAKLKPVQAELVFDKKEHKVRTVEEQKAVLAIDRAAESVRRHRGTVTHDSETNRITARDATPDQVRDYLRKNGL